MKTLRLFISSPGDVGRERHATAEVIRRLQSEFAEHVTLDPYFWEWEPVDFSKDYQANIPSTAKFDIVICILWSRLGSRLSDQHKLPPDYTRPASSGTEFELLEALYGQQQHPERLPDLLVWKNDSPPPPASAPPLTREEEDERIRQRRALQDFLTSVTRDADTGSFIAALNSYSYLDEFEDLMDKKLRKLIQKHIGQRSIKPKPQWQGSPFRDLDVFEFEHAPIFFGRSRAVGEVVRLLQSTLSKAQPCHFALILGASGSGKSSLARAGVLPLLTRPGVIEGIGLWRCAIVRPSDDSADLFQALAASLLRSAKKDAQSRMDSHRFREPADHKSNESPICGFPESAANPPPALPELADPESPNPQQSLAAELRAHPQTVAIRVKDQLSAAAKAHQTQQRHTLETQIASLTQEGRQADAALKQQALQNLQEPKARLVLLLDQMEELFTLNYAPEQLRTFLETIAVLARSGRVFVIGTLRSDFYPRYQEQPTLVALARDGARFDLLPPTPDEISQIIRRPASLAALQFEPHPTTAEHTLADTLRDEALADTEALPLLEHVLNRLYQAQLPRADGRLTFADYEEICGVDVDPKTGVKTSRGVGGALGKHAEDIFSGQNLKPTDPPPWTEDTFRAVFRCLVTFGKGEGDTDVPNRRAFTYQDLIQSDPAAQALVDTFIHERLLIADTDAQSRPIVRLSHEALLTRWPRLANWLQTAPVRDLMSQRRRLESSLRQWQEQNRTSDCYLQPGFELEEGKQLLEKHEAALKGEEREFIRDSVAYHAERERKAKQGRRIVISVLAALTCVAIAAGVSAWRETENTRLALVESNRQLERSQVEEGRTWLERGRAALNKGDHLSALMLAGRAIGFQRYGRRTDDEQTFSKDFPLILAKTMKDLDAEKERAAEADQVMEFIDSIKPTLLPLWAGTMTGGVNCIVFSPDGSRLASGSFDGTIKLWDTVSGKALCSLNGHTKYVSSVDFSSDGLRLVSGSWDKTIKLWDAATGKQINSFNGHTDDVTSVAFSPDGARLASGSSDHTIKLWDPFTGKEVHTLMGHTKTVTSVAFSPDSAHLASGSYDTTIRLWDTATSNEVASFIGHTRPVSCIAISRDGNRLVSGSGNSFGGEDKSIRVWDIVTRKEIIDIKGHQFGVEGIALSPEGTVLASSDSQVVKLWNVGIGREIASFGGHTASIDDVIFSPDGTRLASCSSDHTIKLWDVAARKEVAALHTHDMVATVAQISPDYSHLAGGATDGSIRIWHIWAGKELAVIGGHLARVASLIFSPDGKLLATGSADKTIKVWEIATGQELLCLRGHTGAIESLAFSPDGARLASGSEDKTVKIWSVASGEELVTLFGHTGGVGSMAFSPDGFHLATGSRDMDMTCRYWDTGSAKEIDLLKLSGSRLVTIFEDGSISWDAREYEDFIKWMADDLAIAKQWLAGRIPNLPSSAGLFPVLEEDHIFILSDPRPNLDLAARLHVGLLALSAKKLEFPEITQPTRMLHVRQDTLAQLADPKLTPERRAELRMELCAKSSQFRAATALWQRLLQGEWPGFEGATVPKDQAPATIPADSPIRRLYLLALIDATKHPQIHGHPTICHTAAQIAPVLTKEMMATPTISLAMMSLMQTLAKDEDVAMNEPRAAMMKKLEEVATKDWLTVLRETTAKQPER